MKNRIHKGAYTDKDAQTNGCLD